MTREMEYAKCMAVLRKIIRMGMITENEYVAARNKLMDKYLVIRDLENQVAKYFRRLVHNLKRRYNVSVHRKCTCVADIFFRNYFEGGCLWVE